MPVIRRIRRDSYPEQDQETDGNRKRDTERESGRDVYQKEKQPPAGDGDEQQEEENDNGDEEGVHAHRGHRHDLLEEVGISTEDAFVGYTADRAVSINVRFSFLLSFTSFLHFILSLYSSFTPLLLHFIILSFTPSFIHRLRFTI